MGLQLRCGREPLDRPRDRFLAERVVANRALVRATDGAGLDVDLSLVMAGLDFETVWAERRVFRVGTVDIPVARLGHIIESKRRVGREKDRMFLATHAEAIRELTESDERFESPAQLAPTKAEGQSSTPSTVIRRGRTSGRRRPPPIVRTRGRA